MRDNSNWLPCVLKYSKLIQITFTILLFSFISLFLLFAVLIPYSSLAIIRKSYTLLSSFRPTVDTTSSCYYFYFLTLLLTLFTHNKFVLKHPFDTAVKILDIPLELFDNSYIFALFDVGSLFINVSLNRTVNIILDCIYDENFVNTNLRKRTLKKLIKVTCSKTAFIRKKKLYQQTDNVSMGSTLGPLLGNIIMTRYYYLFIIHYYFYSLKRNSFTEW